MRDISRAIQTIADKTHQVSSELVQANKQIVGVQETIEGINSASWHATEAAGGLADGTKKLVQIAASISSTLDQAKLTVLNAALKSARISVGSNSVSASIEKARKLCGECKAATDQARKLSETVSLDAEKIMSVNKNITETIAAAKVTCTRIVMTYRAISDVLKLSEAIAKAVCEMSSKEQDFLEELSAALSIIGAGYREDGASATPLLLYKRWMQT
jgi:methyl-accepting chemotaxis protein